MMPSTYAPLTRGQARLAGALYLVIIVCGIGSEAFIRQRLVVPDDAHATAVNILASEGLFRVGVLADVAMALSDVALGVLLYVLFAPVSRTLALLATAFRLTQTAILGANLIHLQGALLTLQAAAGAQTAEGTQLEELATLALHTHAHGYDLGLFFFGVNSVLMGVLLLKSKPSPKAPFSSNALGVLMAFAGGVYLVGSTLRFVAPSVSDAFTIAYALPVVAELSLCMWLFVNGGRRMLAHGSEA